MLLLLANFTCLQDRGIGWHQRLCSPLWSWWSRQGCKLDRQFWSCSGQVQHDQLQVGIWVEMWRMSRTSFWMKWIQILLQIFLFFAHCFMTNWQRCQDWLHQVLGGLRMRERTHREYWGGVLLDLDQGEVPRPRNDLRDSNTIERPRIQHGSPLEDQTNRLPRFSRQLIMCFVEHFSKHSDMIT